jgi:hypothetical protein
MNWLRVGCAKSFAYGTWTPAAASAAMSKTYSPIATPTRGWLGRSELPAEKTP